MGMRTALPTGHVTMAMSLDGFIARKDHSLDWLMKQKIEGEDHGFEEFTASIDGMVMGSGTFKTVIKFGKWLYTKPVVVLSQSLNHTDIPEELRGKVEVSNQKPRALMERFREMGWKRVYVDGGKVVQSFLREGLINDINIAHIPILIGSGIRMFGELSEDIDLELIESKTYPSGIVKTFYRIA